VTAALVAALLGVPMSVAAEPAPDLGQLQAGLASATAQAESLSLALEQAAAADAGYGWRWSGSPSSTTGRRLGSTPASDASGSPAGRTR